MTAPPSLTVSRRDAAVAAALTGTVVVVLGYASGLGLQTDSASLAQPPASAPVVPETSMTMPVEPTLPAMSAMSTMPEMAPVPAVPMNDMPGMTPTDPTTTEPVSTPDPSTSEPTASTNGPSSSCPPALLETLPVVGPVTAPVTSLLSSVLGSLPVLGALDCLVGQVLGPQCCANEVRP